MTFFGSETFAVLHVAISLAAITSGFVGIFGLVAGKRLDRWTAFFFATTALTSVTGFLFPFNGFTPGLAVGVVSLIVLAVAVYARYAKRLLGWWGRGYAITAVTALYLNVFVLIVQAFQKVPLLHALSPAGNEPPFAVVQGLTLIAFVALGWLRAKRFRAAA